MIRHLEDSRAFFSLPFVQTEPLMARLTVNVHAYGLTSPFFDLWAQQTETETTAVVGRLDGAVTLVATPRASFSELALFCRAVGFERLLCTCKTAWHLPFAVEQQAVLLKRTRTPPEENTPTLSWDFAPSPRLLYRLLASCTGQSIQLAPFDGWYVDVSHKQRRGLVRSVVAFAGETAVGCAMTAGETEKLALVSAVAVRPECRGHGYGKALVTALANTIQEQGKQVYLLRDKEENEAFYRPLGFEEKGECAFLLPQEKSRVECPAF